MTRSMRWIQGGLGAALTVLGAAASVRVLLPDGGPRSSSVEGWMFMGPALATFGILLVWTARGRGSDEEREALGPRILLQLGLAFLVPPLGSWIWRALWPGALAEYAWNVTAFLLGVPGVALTATGVILLLWRSAR